MVGKIFSFLCITSFIFGIATGNIDKISNSAFEGAQKAVTLTMSLMGTMCLFCGIMSILEKSGAINKFSRLISPVLKLIFPESFSSGIGKNEICANISANILGIGNAATPIGINAMQALKKNCKKDGVATNDMIMLVVLNTSSLDILPTTIIALRQSCNSAAPYDIILPTILCSFACSLFAIILTRTMGKICSQ